MLATSAVLALATAVGAACQGGEDLQVRCLDGKVIVAVQPMPVPRSIAGPIAVAVSKPKHDPAGGMLPYDHLGHEFPPNPVPGTFYRSPRSVWYEWRGIQGWVVVRKQQAAPSLPEHAASK